VTLKGETRGESFGFDAVFGADGSGGAAPSAALYVRCVAPLVEGVFAGINGTVFAYGQTGAGKSFTMVSNSDGFFVRVPQLALFYYLWQGRSRRAGGDGGGGCWCLSGLRWGLVVVRFRQRCCGGGSSPTAVSTCS
jgi:hypothetical protein